jgi:Fe-S cluster assembly protein SufD
MTAVVEQRLDFGPASVAAGAGDSPLIAELRAKAAKLASEMDWPNSRAQRPWKYYDISAIGLNPDTPLAKVTSVADSSEGARVVPLHEADGADADLVAKHFGTAVRPATDRITALHYAYHRGVLVHVPANVEAAPVRISTKVSGAGLVAPHTLIVTGANSRVTVVEEFSSDDLDATVFPAAEIIPGPSSEVRYYVVHRWGDKTKVFLNQRFLGSNDSAAVQNVQVVLSGEVVKGHLESSLIGRGSASELLGTMYGTGKMHGDFFTLQDHIGPDTRSDLEYKSALRDESVSVYYGLTKVGLGAKNADANQENRNLLLSKTARADSDPVLEILTSDIIRAAHGATAGPVDQEQLFYMQARGIPHDDAEAMLVHAFLEDVLGRIPDETVRAELVAIVEESLD